MDSNGLLSPNTAPNMEEENDLSISQTISTKTLNPRSQKKHAAMIERLSNLHQSRLNQSISRRSDADSSAPFESTQAFLNRFADSKRSIESELDRLRFISNDLESNPQPKSDLDKLSISISDLEKLVAENSYFLPSYEVRSTLKAIAELKESLESVNLKLVPRKKFSFRNKPAKKDPANAVKESEISAKELDFPVKGGDDAASAEKSRFEARDSPGFRNEVGAVLVKQFEGFESGDFTLSNLESCEIRLKGRLRALFVHRLKNCRVFVGPVLGSILIEEAEGCLFMLASHQIRIHHAKETDFYLRVRSRPIIEDCSSVRFAPYFFVYEGIEEGLRESSLAEDTGNWANVDDFRWLRAVQSPNWCILPKEEQAASHWLFIYPQGLRDLLVYYKERYQSPTIYITENGVDEFNNKTSTLEEALRDDVRIDFYREHLAWLHKAIREGVDVTGYFAWTLLDNFEWSDGYTVRFGINYVDFDNGLKR